MIKRTWKYGSELDTTVLEIIGNTIVLLDEKKELHVLAGRSDGLTLHVGEGARIRFCSGGPTGGYWGIVKKIEPLVPAIPKS